MAAQSRADAMDDSDLIGRAADPRDPSFRFIVYPGRRTNEAVREGDWLVGRSGAAPSRITATLPRDPARRGRFVAVDGGRRTRRIAGADGLLLPGLAILRASSGTLVSGSVALSAERPLVREGSNGPAVLEAQKRLNLLLDMTTTSGLPGPAFAPLPEDGRWSPAMTAAVRAFQRFAVDDGLSDDGVLGPQTWAVLLRMTEQDAHPPQSSSAPDGPRSGDPASESPDAPQSDIATNLAAITVTTTTQDLGLRPDAPGFSALAWSNTPAKRTVFGNLEVARKAAQLASERLASARAAVAPGAIPTHVQAQVIATAETKSAAAQQRVNAASEAMLSWLRTAGPAHNRRLSALRALRQKLTKQLASAHTTVAQQAAQAALDNNRNDIAAAEAEYARQLAVFVPMVPTIRNTHAVSVDGVVVQLYDHVTAYATIDNAGFEGQATGDGRAAVSARINQIATGDDQRILAIISRHEGTFSNINTWDRAIVTWGFIQWTFGEAGDGSLVGLLREIKRLEPAIFRDRLQRFGIDVDQQHVQLTRADGSVLNGSAAAAAIQTDVKLAAALSRLGVVPAAQDIQVRHAIRTKINQMLARRVPGHDVHFRDVVTSSYGVGVMTDRAVGGGEGAVSRTAATALNHFKKQHPDAQLGDPAWAAQAEPDVVAALAAMDPQRAQSYVALSHAHGSYSP